MTRGLSASETRALAQKAARGAGYDWGLAEEAGQVATTLDEWDWPGLYLLDLLLGQKAETAGLGVWCPLRLGAYLSDMGDATRLPGRAAVSVAVPALVLPALAACGGSVVVRWDDAVVTLTDEGIVGQGDGLTAAACQEFRVEAVTYGQSVGPGPVLTAPANWTPDRLERLAMETFVPESAASRDRGAG